MQIIIDLNEAKSEGHFLVIERRHWLVGLIAVGLVLMLLIYGVAYQLARYWVSNNTPLAVELTRTEVQAANADRERLWMESIGLLQGDIADVNARLMALYQKGAALSDYLGVDDDGAFDSPDDLTCDVNAVAATPEERNTLLASAVVHQSSFIDDLTRKYNVLSEQGVYAIVQEYTIPMKRPILGKNWRTSNYGYRRDPFTGRRAFHSGVDYAARSGTLIMAGASGVVIYNSRLGNYGNAVQLYHGNNISTLYGHMKSVDVKLWQYIHRGDIIGTVGSTGRSSGPHLHYEVRINNRPKPVFGTIKKLRKARNINT